MIRKIILIAICGAFFTTTVQAGICISGRNLKTGKGTERDYSFGQSLFSDSTYKNQSPKLSSYVGNAQWNKVILQCNRTRDTNGVYISAAIASKKNSKGKQLLRKKKLKSKVIRGKFNFLGLGSAINMNYVYVLRKKNNVWHMTIPYKPIHSDLVKDRVDFNISHAYKLYAASQVKNGKLVSNPKPIWTTHCAKSTYFPGKKKKYAGKPLYKRDKRNKHISVGKIEYQYGKKGSPKSGCRVKSSMNLYWENADGKIIKTKPLKWVYSNFVRVAEKYWTIPGVFKLRLWMEGHNDHKFKGAKKLLRRTDHLTVRFATKFLAHGFNQMYKSNPLQPFNFSTMTSDNTHEHEVGHAFGLDDEYGGAKKNDCEKISGYDTNTYTMCAHNVTEKRTIYHYIAVSRYILP
ncbi:MAG: hypothetical protein GKS01_13315 [Alphaproteobacteria bacterium]|nr:hypothetical protein [Alphaproteobacteria bacterium]